MKFPRNAKIFRGQLDVAPFASVFFLLAVFMVFSSLLVSSPGVKIQLPEFAGSEFTRVSLPKLDVAVDASGKIYFESQRVTHQELRSRLEIAVARFTNNKPTLVLQADEDADLGTVLQICQIAVEIGIMQTVWTGRAKPFETENQSTEE
jgi:biopolymer transport protein TolR